jgi:polysaccharide pyruvyl transferase CsaB
MTHVALLGYYGFANAGDEAILRSMIADLREKDPDIEFSVLSGDPAKTASYYRVKAVHRMRFGEVFKVLRSCDLLIVGGGGLLQDATSGRSIPYYLGVTYLAKLLGKRVMFYAQGVGPIRGWRGKFLTKMIVNKVDYITVRDRGSLELLQSLGVRRPPMEVTADPVLLLRPSGEERVNKIFREKGVAKGDRIIGVSVRNWKEYDEYKTALAEALNHIVRELEVKVAFIPMHHPHDIEASADVMRMIEGESILIDEELSPEELLTVIGKMDFIVGMRLHSLIFAATMGVPAVGITYDAKVKQFMELAGIPQGGTIEELNVADLLIAIQETWRKREELLKNMKERITRLQGLSARNSEIALDLAHKGGDKIAAKG